MIKDYDILILSSDDLINNVNLDYILGKHFDSAYVILTKKKIYAYVSSLEIGNISKIHSELLKKDISLKVLSKKNLITDIKKIIINLILNKNNSNKIIVGIDYEKTNIIQKSRLIKLFKHSFNLIKNTKDLELNKINKINNINKINSNIINNDEILKKYKFIFKDSSIFFNDMRIIKKDSELNKIKFACKLTDKIFSKTIDFIKNNISSNKLFETDIVNFMKKLMIDNNVSESFPIIVASGKNSSCPHHKPSGKFQNGFCIIDFGIKYEGYCSDMTRTIFVGEPTQKEKDLYIELLRIQEKIIEESKPNVKLDYLDSLIKKLLGENSKYFIHSLGHGVGLEIHEKPFFREDKYLKSGMVLAIEPGIYFSDSKNKFEKLFGIRIEDTIFIDKNQEILTKSNKDLIIIK